MQTEARPACAGDSRHDVIDILTRECPGVDLAAAALIVTELVANVVNHAYPDTGPIEVELLCGADTATLTVRDWGCGLGESTHHGLGIGLQIVEALAQDVHIHPRQPTEVRACLARAIAG